ncbi:MAG: hypothetical protein HOU81_09060 [Hamadaea sp.]|uniref:hypothetical protein n=1 Tax=Hamadaea sp. TaxID=2024425 RepID=UPI0017CC70EA|nr:hypothetical protein [Hamadaea sp.]NUR70957.1 hypothetical protein [Hamadaea sp.]NUT21744.1 hypothetical protein [Hamadaea sp.]
MSKVWGSVGIAAAVLWAAGILLQYADADSKPGELLIDAGFIGIAAMIAGMLAAGIGGRGVFPAIGLGLWSFGHLSIALGGFVEMATGNADNPFYPIGGLGQIVGGILAAVAIARAGVLTGWRRWTPVAWVVTYLAVFATLFTASDDGVQAWQLAPFAVWLATIALTGYAVATASAADGVVARTA